MKLILGFFIACSISFATYAQIIETSSFKTPSNQTVAVGDSLEELMSRTGQSPVSIKTSPYINNGSSINAMQYEYSIGDFIYSVTVVNEQVRKIEKRPNI